MGAGVVFIYTKPENGGWADATQTAKLGPMMDSPYSSGSFGWSVDIDGDTIVVGDKGRYSDGDTGSGGYGAVFIFEKQGSEWSDSTTPTAMLLDDGMNNYFGYSVAVDGDTVVVGRGNDETPTGPSLAKVFVKPGGGWADTSTPTAILTPPTNFQDEAQPGETYVAIRGDTVVLAGPWWTHSGHYDNDVGEWVYQMAAYVFVKPSGGWGTTNVPDANLASSNFYPNSANWFGAVAIDSSGETVVAGATGGIDGGSNKGAVFVFEKAGGWSSGTTITTTQTAILTDTGGAMFANLGRSVAIEGDIIVAGAPGLSGQGLVGKAHLYKKPDTGWADTGTPDQTLTPGSDSAAEDAFGYAVAAAPKLAAATRPGNFSSGTNNAAYTFDAPPTPPELTAHTPITNTVTAPVNSNVTLTYSAEMEETSITSRTVAVHSMMRGLITDATRTAAGEVVTINPADNFFPGELVYAIPTTGTTDITGTHAIAGPQWQFNAEAPQGYGRFDETPTTFGNADGDKVSAFAWGDMDNDGDLDLAIAVNEDSSNGKNLVYPNNGDGTFGTPIDISTCPAPVNSQLKSSDIAWGDMDNDGDLDLAVATNTLGNFVIPNNGNGTFGAAAWVGELAAFEYTMELAWGDMDNDGDLDLALANGADSTPASKNQNKIYLNNGDGTFDTTPILVGTTSQWSTDIAWGDYNNDGHLDLAVANTLASDVGGTDYNTYIYPNNGNGGFDTPLTMNSGNDGWGETVAWGDYDHDGDLDLAAGANIHPNNGDGTFAAHLNLADSMVDNAWGDFDADGNLDLAVTELYTVTVYPNRGSGTFGPPVIAGTCAPAYPCWEIAWADADNDDDLDLSAIAATAPLNLYFNTPPPPTLTDHSPITNTVDAPLDSSVVLTYSAEMSQTTITSQTVAVHSMMRGLITDATRSADGEVVTIDPADNFFPGELVYAINTAGTTDITGTNTIPTQWQFNAAVTAGWGMFDETPVEFGTGSDETWSVAWGDVDGDGDLDLAVGNYGNQNAVYLNNGDGTLDNNNPITFGVAPAGHSNDYTYSVAWGDFDNDGDLDLALGNTLQSAVYLNNGDNTFDNDNPITFAGSEDVTHSVAWGDFDNDGDLDLVAGTHTQLVENRSAVYLNNGDGTLDTTTPITFGVAAPLSVAWGDVDNDGDLDLAVGNDGGQNAVYLNNGDGTVDNDHPITIGSAGGTTYGVAWGDVDNDGDLDIAVGGYSLTNFVYRNHGDGTFIYTDRIIVGSGSNSDKTQNVAWGDIDNDGDLDLAVGNDSEQQNAVYLNAAPAPDVTISKSVSPAFAQPGDAITYTLRFSNTGSLTATNVVITDSVPLTVTNPTVADSSGATITQTGTAPNFTWDVENLSPDEGGVITLTGALTSPLGAGVFTNTAVITATDDGNASNNTGAIGVAHCGNLITVVNTNDSGPGSLRQALLGACSGGTVEFNLTYPATITLSGEIEITKALTIDGPGADNLTISGNETDRAFNIGDGSYNTDVTISGLTLKNGKAPDNDTGGAIYTDSPLTLTAISLISNTTNAQNAGAVYADSDLVVVDSLFENNSATSYAGAIEVYGNLFISNTRFISNTASGSDDGAVYADADAVVINSLFQGNEANGNGGAMEVSGLLTITNTRFIDNRAANNGGALYVPGNIQAVNSLFAGNSAGTPGGGAVVYLDSTGGNNAILHATVVSATLGSGAAFEVNAGTLAITNSIIANYTTGISNSGTVNEDYNLFAGNTTDRVAVTPGANSLSGTFADADFVDAAGGDFHLDRHSLAIDAGTDAGVTTDFDGDSRPSGSGFDMGYDEAMSAPDVTIAKTVSPTSAKPGDAITYTLRFSNTGNLTATGVVITDSVPGDVTNPAVADSSGATINLTGTAPNFAWDVENLSPDEGGVITLTGVLTEPLAAFTLITNTAEIICTDDGDATNNSSKAALTVQNIAPTAVDDTALVMRNDSGDLTLLFTAPVTIPVLVNDSDPNSGNNIGLTVTAVGDGSQGGTVDVNSNGKLVDYSPTAAFTGTETFTYTVSDGGLADTATVTVTVVNGDGGGSTTPDDDDGETIVIPDTGISGTITVTVQIPAGVATDTFALVYNEIVSPTESVPQGFVLAGLSFTLDAYLNQVLQPDYVLSTPITLTVEYSDEDVPDIPQGEEGLELRYWDSDEGKWSSDGASVVERDTANNRLIISITHLAEFALFGKDTSFYYFPLIVKGYVTAPDLVITALSGDSSGISLTIKNIGNKIVVNDFWVDVYFGPQSEPQINQRWYDIANAGAAWGVTKNLEPDEELTLTVGDEYYDADESSDTFPDGATVYGLVDSINYATNYGNVWESNEANNLWPAAGSTEVQTASGGRGASTPGLPQR